MSKLREHLTESSLLGSMNRSVPNEEVANAVEGAMEEIRFQLELVKKTGTINKNLVKELSKSINDLRKLSDKIVKDLKSQEK